MDKICQNCEYFKEAQIVGLGICRRYPQAITKEPNDFCGEFYAGQPSEAILSTAVSAPGWFSADTLMVLRKNHIKTIADIIDCGRPLTCGPIPLNRKAIEDIAITLKKHGISW